MSNNRKTRLDALEDRLTGPKRIALFGHRAVGKTTLLSMFYREASNGRVPLVRLAAGDAITAEYLADKIAQIEAGEPLPGTLAETPLRLRLYHGMTRLDMHVKDYQGEHVALGSDAPVQRFFSDCDAVFLCLDGEASENGPDRRRRQLEIEDLLERFIDRSDDGTAGRPLAVIITKYDRVIERGGPPPEWVERLVEGCYGMTRHALSRHAPEAAVFAVSSYGMEADGSGRPPTVLRPIGLEAPLGWLAGRLEELDRAQLDWLFDLAPEDLPRLSRCLAVFERRYPRSEAAIVLRRRLTKLKRRRGAKRALRALAALAVLVAAMVGYDAWGFHQALRVEQSGQPAPAIERQWSALLDQHPSLPYFFAVDARTARSKQAEWQVKSAALRLAVGTAEPELRDSMRALKEQAPELAPQIARVERTADQARQEQAWKALRVADLVAIDDLGAHLASTRQYLREFPETPHRAEAVELINGIEGLLAERRARDDRLAIDSLVRAAGLPGAQYRELIEETRQLLAQRAESPYRDEMENVLDLLVTRGDEVDIEKARQFSRANPASFAARREKYLDYLKAHTNGGRYVAEANAELDRIDHESDVYLYNQAYHHYITYRDDVPAVAERLRAYLQANPEGRFAGPAREYLTWWEKISVPGDYRVVLRRGKVEPGVGKPFSGEGPDLGVTVWVAGVEYGPSPVIKDSRAPIWDHTFSTPVRWKYGDPVAIRIVDYDWSPSGVFTFTSRVDDKLAMRLLSGTIRPSKGGPTELLFASDFHEPNLPKPQ